MKLDMLWEDIFKKDKKMEKNSVINILSSILAVGAIAGGAYDAGTAILMGGQHLGTARMLTTLVLKNPSQIKLQ